MKVARYAYQLMPHKDYVVVSEFLTENQTQMRFGCIPYTKILWTEREQTPSEKERWTEVEKMSDDPSRISQSWGKKRLAGLEKQLDQVRSEGRSHIDREKDVSLSFMSLDSRSTVDSCQKKET